MFVGGLGPLPWWAGQFVYLSVGMRHHTSRSFNSRHDRCILLTTPHPPPLCSSSCPPRRAAGKCSIRMKITDDKTTMERRRFRIKVEAVGRADIEAALTDKLTVM